MKLKAAAKTFGIPDDSVDSEAELRIGKDEFDLHHLSAAQLSGNVNSHAFRRQIMTPSLQSIFALLHNRKQRNGKTHLMARRTPRRRPGLARRGRELLHIGNSLPVSIKLMPKLKSRAGN